MNEENSTTEISPHNRRGRFLAWCVIGLFILGLKFKALGAFTDAIGAVWLIGTQKPLRGFVLVAGFALIPKLLFHWNPAAMPIPHYLGWMILGTIIFALPLLLHRVISPRLNGILSTLPLPLWGIALQWLGQSVIPAGAWNVFSLTQTQNANAPLMQVAATLGTGAIVFLIYWLAALINWMWDYDFRRKTLAVGTSAAGIVFAIAFGYGICRQIDGHAIPANLPSGSALAGASLIGGMLLCGLAMIQAMKPKRKWADRPEIVALLRSPRAGEPLHVETEKGKEVLLTPSGERFPIRGNIPDFAKPGDVTGSNRKYNQLYETVGGFYDGAQKIALALMNVSKDYLFKSVLGFLEIKPGDLVLETSVGTGLCFPYLPAGVKRFGLDLAWNMLRQCQTNLRRWEMDAELFHGNAENLPFADNTFDAVYHVGGINFFNDRAKGIREMIRVAKPGTRIVISDESEQHVKSSYERTPIASGYFKNRTEKVKAPIDLVPPEMQELHLEAFFGNRAYIMTFRKPKLAGDEGKIISQKTYEARMDLAKEDTHNELV
jgi:ubiquinone/menaquinone biosynthesis C-methylase UbiE